MQQDSGGAEEEGDTGCSRPSTSEESAVINQGAQTLNNTHKKKRINTDTVASIQTLTTPFHHHPMPEFYFKLEMDKLATSGGNVR